MAKIPPRLQSILWSVNVKKLNLHQDRAYIINHVLAYGSWEDLKWLFKTYPEKVIKQIFIQKPMKVYSPAAFNFTKEILLKLENKNLDSYQYETNLPRIIRS